MRQRLLPQIRRRKPQVWYDTLTVGVTPPVTKGDIPLWEGDNITLAAWCEPLSPREVAAEG